MNLSDYKGILVFAEQRDGVLQNVGLELIGEAKKLAAQLKTPVTVVLMGYNIQNLAQTLIDYGADIVVVIDNEHLKQYDTEAYAQAFKVVIEAKKPEIVLLGATTLGRDLAPRVSSRMNTGLTADCTKLDIDETTNVFGMTRPAFGGNLMATIVCPDHRPQMATVRPGVMQKLPKEEGRKGEIEVLPVNIDTSKMKVKILDIVKETSKKVDITEAKILVSGGRGVGSKENFKNLEAVASKIGAEVSASRAAVDAGFIEQSRQVGQTGKTVRPDIYFACGISGAIQHMAGMEESEFIIAINKDKDAPMFGIADLGIVGDVNKILPLLAEELAKAIEAKKSN
ncbi:electron transfer flavoprotein subunit alpha/FixB family protein [Brachyspira hampsonii]|uniref:Electron transfer flavoprotein subunit alpha n=1 Tax=Brachyspira hampsonii 30446 TaxID=1289135 RepID=A0A2U4FFH8_9SPIR|nr:electron transfer flavoprotein subunit alpha/FixB family protein [Brachyspira hampsonii]EKV58334.1 electron transfer flavoprotein alpha/beta- subunit [Brachyspira hampsonii 30446]MBW5388933.1 electron transfer flavoprotein subunit alpha/FixB family protein [Brachyspira hampsonii]MBW5393636.1 electron transfer flavoprotein subunit alpha/FixB family protein [Brachyspira hampsonii]OEJ16562.1 electron transfer flavoprotein subunit alpha [Brachyspira hampsonii]PTY39280.1 electron transfer flavop